MDFVSELKPNRLGSDQYRTLITPIIIAFLYFVFLYFQSFIMETNDEEAIGYTYYLKGYFFFGFGSLSVIPTTFNLFIVAFFAIWISIRTINLNGSIGNVGISAFVFGFVYFLLDLLFFLSYLIQVSRFNDNLVISDYISQQREFLVSNFLFNLLEFMVLAVVFAGIYFEIIKNLRPTNSDLYPTT